MKIILLSLFWVFFSFGKIFVAQWEGPITPTTADYVERTIQKAQKEGGTLYILLLNTPGGLVESMRKIIQSFETAPFPIVVYVYPPGGRAASAGAIITIAADIAAMAPGTNIGAAHPVLATPQGREKKEKGKDVMMEKVLQDMLAFVRAIAKEKGRNVKVVEKMVKESLSLSAEEALKKGVIDLIAYNLEDLLTKLEGKKVKKLNAVYEIRTKGKEVVFLKPSLREEFLKIITNPTVAYLLLMLGFYGIFFELYNPGAIIPGVLGAICLLLGLYGLSVISINWLALLLIVLGILFFVLELLTPTFGALALGGAISILLGSLFLVEEGSPYGEIPKQLIISVSIFSAIFFLGVGYLGLKAQKRKKLTGIEGMIGEEGEAIVDFKNGRGKVFVHGEIWDAVSEDDIKKGDTVKVVGAKGLKLIVKKSS
ncbi:NfeD family protein [Aquifex aeolicus]|uniref:Nodulation competitiveness protein NfeD n=1 Tax=Aquifex aeolicus (strain VF5) TaxID=224324 RepID=O67682_AQUAE|nr:nodulation protein NfeD [Aquifex aeolicus]AAC07639.1 nodulation competitiveness protein NfeD [Aquifex aeolicus VF5]